MTPNEEPKPTPIELLRRIVQLYDDHRVDGAAFRLAMAKARQVVEEVEREGGEG